MRVALFEPEIAGNVGAVLRLGACLGAAVDLIEPMGFAWDDRRVRRTAMDYIDHVEVARHVGFDAFRAAVGGARLVLFTTRASASAYEFGFAAGDVLLFGKESAGVPAAVADACEARVRLPMRPQVRSMNLATSVALALGEAMRQTSTLPAARRAGEGELAGPVQGFGLDAVKGEQQGFATGANSISSARVPSGS